MQEVQNKEFVIRVMAYVCAKKVMAVVGVINVSMDIMDILTVDHATAV